MVLLAAVDQAVEAGRQAAISPDSQFWFAVLAGLFALVVLAGIILATADRRRANRRARRAAP